MKYRILFILIIFNIVNFYKNLTLVGGVVTKIVNVYEPTSNTHWI